MKTLVENVTQDSFQKEVLEAGVPIIVDFYADWCAPCRAIAPFLSDLAEQYEGRVEVKKVNVDEDPELTAKLGVSGIPNLIFFKNGQEVKRVTGLGSKDTLESGLRNLLDLN